MSMCRFCDWRSALDMVVVFGVQRIVTFGHGARAQKSEVSSESCALTF